MPVNFLKIRTEPDELKVFRSLYIRYKLTEEQQQYYLNLEKGFQGELVFDERLKKLSGNFLILSDITFKHNNKTFQIDSFLIAQHKCIMFEVKNFEGDYIIKNQKFYSVSGKMLSDPLLQLERSESLLHQLFQHHGINFEREGYLVYVNPDFTLYNAPINPQVIFPTQLNRFIKKLDSIPSNLNKFHFDLAEKLLALSINENKYSQKPDYNFDDLKKGFTCGNCDAFVNNFKGHNICCDCCGHIESFQSAILRHVEEFSLLFPDRKITTKSIMEFCDLKEHEKTIQRILLKNYISIGFGRGTYYIKRV